MDDVRVHYNSDKPAKVNALAYAQGLDIYLASNQEKHLPHEAWHVVQQKQGRVKGTKQLKSGEFINTDEELEREADEMGAKALNENFINDRSIKDLNNYKIDNASVLQRYYIDGNKKKISLEEGEKRLKNIHGISKRIELKNYWKKYFDNKSMHLIIPSKKEKSPYQYTGALRDSLQKKDSLDKDSKKFFKKMVEEIAFEINLERKRVLFLFEYEPESFIDFAKLDFEGHKVTEKLLKKFENIPGSCGQTSGNIFRICTGKDSDVTTKDEFGRQELERNKLKEFLEEKREDREKDLNMEMDYLIKDLENSDNNIFRVTFGIYSFIIEVLDDSYRIYQSFFGDAILDESMDSLLYNFKNLNKLLKNIVSDDSDNRSGAQDKLFGGGIEGDGTQGKYPFLLFSYFKEDRLNDDLIKESIYKIVKERNEIWQEKYFNKKL